MRHVAEIQSNQREEYFCHRKFVWSFNGVRSGSVYVVVRTVHVQNDYEEGNAHIGGSRGAPAAPPPTGSISFVFTYIFAEKCTHRRLASPQREILDPPLAHISVFITSTEISHKLVLSLSAGERPFTENKFEHIYKTIS